MAEGLDKQEEPAGQNPTPPGVEGTEPMPEVQSSPAEVSPAAPGTSPEVLAAAAVVGDQDLDAAWAEALAESQTASVSSPKEPSIKEPAMDFNTPGAASARPTLAHPADFPQFGEGPSGMASGNIDMLLDVKLPVSIELGRTTLPISDILHWGPGAIVELDKLAGEPVNLLVNNVLVARGEVVVVDENFGLRITSLLSSRERVERA
jgi:flagellar motor switch protein FliN